MQEIFNTKNELMEGIQVRLKAVKAIDALAQYANSLEKELSSLKSELNDLKPNEQPKESN